MRRLRHAALCTGSARPHHYDVCALLCDRHRKPCHPVSIHVADRNRHGHDDNGHLRGRGGSPNRLQSPNRLYKGVERFYKANKYTKTEMSDKNHHIRRRPKIFNKSSNKCKFDIYYLKSNLNNDNYEV